ncbi:glycosyltransferase family 61 protein [Methylobacterium sp. CM6241]
MSSVAETLDITPDSEPVALLEKDGSQRLTLKLKRLAIASQWVAMLKLVKKNEGLSGHPAILVYRLRAALELQKRDEIKRCCATIRQITDSEQLLTFASTLLKWEKPLEAARILTKLPSTYRSEEARQLAKRVYKLTKDATARKRVRHLLFLQAPSGRITTEEHRFPSDSDNYTVPPSRIEVMRLNGIDPEIGDSVREMFAQFEAVLEQRRFPAVTEYRDVFIDKVGMIWSADGSVVQASTRAVPTITDLSSIPVFDEAYSCLGRHKGYFEWIVRRLSGLAWRLEPSTPDCPILLRAEQAGLAADALGALGMDTDALITVEGPVFCRRLYAGYVSIGTLARTTAFQPVYGALIEAAERQNNAPTPGRFYISRRDSARRSMTNEADFERALIDRGITPIVLSQLGLLEKINLFRNAELVIGAHGAGFSHLVFAKPGMRVIEIAPTTLAKSKMLGVQTCFTRLSTVYGHHHTFVLHPMKPATSEWSPDIAEIDRLLAAN